MGEGDERRAEKGGPLSLGPTELERIIHRAAELQFGEAGGGSEALSEEEVLRIGREVGLPDHHLRRALSELRAEAQLPRPPPDPRWARRVLGDAVVNASRPVPGEPEGVQERVEEHFRERESLAEVRRREGFSLWEPAGGVRVQLQRALDWEGRGYPFAKIPSLELSVWGLEDGWSLVHLTADLRKVRTEHAVAWSVPLGFMVVPFTLATAVVGPLAVPGAAALGFAGALGGSAVGTRSTFGSRRHRIRLVLEGFLDRLERGDPLDRLRSGR